MRLTIFFSYYLCLFYLNYSSLKGALPLILLSIYLSFEFKFDLFKFKTSLLLTKNAHLSLNKLQKTILKKNKSQHIPIFLGYGYIFTKKHAERLEDKLKANQNRSSTVIDSFGNQYFDDLEFFCQKKLFTTQKILTSHLLIFGTTGSGKTRLFDLLISQAILRGDSVIIFDPKGDADLIKKAQKCCEFAKRSLDFLRLDPENPQHSICFNPLSCFDNASEIGERISSLMESSASASAFKNYANLAITSATIALLNLHRPLSLRNLKEAIGNNDLNFCSLKEALERIVIKLKLSEVSIFWERLQKILNDEKKFNLKLKALRGFYDYLIDKKFIKNNPDLEILFNISAIDKEYFAKVTNGVLPILTSLTSGTRSLILSNENLLEVLDFSQIINAKKVLHIALPSLKDLKASQNLGKILLSDLTSKAATIYNQQILNDSPPKNQVSIFIDECGEVASNALIQLLNKARGANFSLTLAVQSFRDLVKNGGSDQALQILDNCNSKLCLRVGSLETASVFCDNVNKTYLVNQNKIVSQNFGETNTSDGQSSIQSLKKDALISPQMLMGLKNLEYVASVGGNTLIKGKLPLITQG